MKEQQPLLDKTIVVTRAQDQSSEIRKQLLALGARVCDLPALVIGPPKTWGPLDEALEEIDDFHWIIFSSANGVDAVEKRLNISNRSLSNTKKSTKIAAVGKKTANYLDKLGAKVDFIPSDFVADSLVENFPISGFGLNILLPRVETGGRTFLSNAFKSAGAKVTEVAAYESSCPESLPSATKMKVKNNELDAILFSSGKTSQNSAKLLSRAFGSQWLEKLNNVKIVSIGPQTSLSCKKYFGRVDKEANPHSVEGLVSACIDLDL